MPNGYRIMIGLGLLLVMGWLETGCTSTLHPGTKVAGASAYRKGLPRSIDSSPEAQAAAEEEFEQRVQAQAHYAMGILFELEHKPDQALEEFRQSALADPQHQPLVLEVAAHLLQRERANQAQELLERAVAFPDATAQLYALLGVTYAQLGRMDPAIIANQTALKKNPLLLQPYQNLAHLYLKKKNTKEALKVLQEAARPSRRDAVAWVELAETLIYFQSLMGREAESLQPLILNTLNQAAELQPNSPLLQQKIAEGYKLAGQFAQAIRWYEQLVAQHPELLVLRARLAELHLRHGEKKDAMAQLEAIIRINPSNPQANYLLGLLFLENSDYSKAENYFEKTLMLNESFEQAYFDLARTRLALNKPQEALAILAKAREKKASLFLVEFFTALAYNQLKQYPQAIQHLTAAEVVAATSDTNRLDTHLYFQLGAAYERNKNYEMAEKHFEKCLALLPENAEALNYLGYMWAERGVKLKQAQALIEKALKLDPENAAYLDSLGWVLYRLNRPKDALAYLFKAIALSPKPDPTLFDHLGDVFLALDQPQKAAEAWQKSLAVESNDEIKMKLEKVSTAHSSSKSPPTDK